MRRGTGRPGRQSFKGSGMVTERSSRPVRRGRDGNERKRAKMTGTKRQAKRSGCRTGVRPQLAGIGEVDSAATAL
jgi:hypothetical protein